MSSYDHAVEFIENGGLERIYSILSRLDEDQDNFIFSYAKMKSLEVLNAAISYKQGAMHFLNFCVKKAIKHDENDEEDEEKGSEEGKREKVLPDFSEDLLKEGEKSYEELRLEDDTLKQEIKDSSSFTVDRDFDRRRSRS